jgi:RNA polymerase sigma-70 factor (ECF subfamily)
MAINIKECYEKYMPMVLRRCRKMLKNEEDAVDATQDVFVKLLRGEEKIHGKFPSSFLYTIATNICLNKLRWRRRHSETSHEVIEDFASTEKVYDLVEAKMLIEAILKDESAEVRTICYMYHMDGMTLEEIGKAIGISFSAVRKRLKSFAARAQLHFHDDTGGTV